MQIEALKLLGLPVLEAQLHAHRLLIDKAIKVLNANPIASRVEILVYDTDRGPLNEIFYFPTPDKIPIEFKVCLESYSNRLCAEKWHLEQAIEELRQETFSTN
jgi:hypothetical protein